MPEKLWRVPACRSDASDTIRSRFGEIEIAFLFIERDMVRQGNAGLDGHFAVSRAPRFAVTGKGLDIPNA